MDKRTIQILFALLRSAICGTKITDEERNCYSSDLLPKLLKISSAHDVVHLLVVGLKQNGLISKEDGDIEKHVRKAVYRYERMQYEYEILCRSFEEARIQFVPLKGSVIRKYYSEAWMRTSCDIDILVHKEDLDVTISYLSDNLDYVEKERATHDVSLFSPSGIHLELHFDLVEEGRAQNAIDVLRSVWDNVALCENSEYKYEMSDAYFYFYHIAHMAKHFETGGCGIRPFLDLWILDHVENIDRSSLDGLLEQGGLLQFAEASRALSRVWFGEQDHDRISMQLQDFILSGGVYGTTDNRVALQQTQKGGRFGYVISRIFIPHSNLKRYYPVLDKHPWLMPFMQIRRWFMLLQPSVAQRTKREIFINENLDKSKADEMNIFLGDIGLK